MQHSWSMQDAKNKFSAVVDAAQSGEPQWVTRRGKPTAVVISVEQYQEQQRVMQAQLPGLKAELLAMPQDDGEFERADLALRDLDL